MADALPQAGADLLALHRMMLRIRRFDERVTELFRAGEIKGTAHSCVGQEAIAAGACAHLTERDWIITHHRGHGHARRLPTWRRRFLERVDGARALGVVLRPRRELAAAHGAHPPLSVCCGETETRNASHSHWPRSPRRTRRSTRSPG